MAKVKIENTTTVGHKVFFSGEAHVSAEDAKALKSDEAVEVEPDPQAGKDEKPAREAKK